MKREEIVQTAVAVVIAAVFVMTGVARFPVGDQVSEQVLRHPPVIVYSEPMLPPAIVRAVRTVSKPAETNTVSKTFAKAVSRLARLGPKRAKPGEKVHVSLTQYCLQGRTRRDHYVREGIVAADPRVFPLAHYVDVFIGERYIGKFLVDDTGAKVKGATLDIWNPSCAEARRFGRQRGTATLVAR